MLQQVHKVTWNNMGKYHSRPPPCRLGRVLAKIFFPDTAASREREDGRVLRVDAIYAAQEEGIDDDDESDETTATSQKKESHESTYTRMHPSRRLDNACDAVAEVVVDAHTILVEIVVMKL